MNKIDRKHIVLQVKTKNLIRFPPLEKLLSLKVMKLSKTAVKTADRSYHVKRHCINYGTNHRCVFSYICKVKHITSTICILALLL